MSLPMIVTTAGRAALVAAAGNGTNAVQITQVGLSASNGSFSVSTTSLPGEFKRFTGVSGAALANGLIHISFHDQSTDAYNAKALAVYLADGTLFAIGGQATTFAGKVTGLDASISLDVQFVDVSSSQITFGNTYLNNPPATRTNVGVLALADPTKTLAGVDDLTAITPAMLKAYIDNMIQAGIDAAKLGGHLPTYYTDIAGRLGYAPVNPVDIANVWRASNDGAGSGLDADLWRGLPPDTFLRALEYTTNAASGHMKLGNGFIICWGFVDVPSDNYGTFPLPAEHQSWVIPVFGVENQQGNMWTQEGFGVKPIGTPPTSIQIWNGTNPGNNRFYILTLGR